MGYHSLGEEAIWDCAIYLYSSLVHTLGSDVHIAESTS